MVEMFFFLFIAEEKQVIECLWNIIFLLKGFWMIEKEYFSVFDSRGVNSVNQNKRKKKECSILARAFNQKKIKKK